MLNIRSILLWPWYKVRGLLVRLPKWTERLQNFLMKTRNQFYPAMKLLHPASKKVSIIIPNYNGQKYLSDCINSLLRLDFPRATYEIIIVDNASSDHSCEFIASTYPEVVLVRAKKNLGFASGCNLGIKNSSGEYIVLLNNDTVVDSNWLKELVAVADASEEIAIVGSKLLFMYTPNTIQNAMSFLTDKGDGGDIGANQPDEGQHDAIREGMAVCGASMLIKRTIIEAIGGLDEDFFAYYEDLDLCYRARLYGKKIVFAPKSVVYHIHSATSGEWSPLFTFLVLRNKLLIHLKNSPVGFLLKVLYLYSLQVISQALLKGIHRRIHLKVLLSFAGKVPKFLLKRFYIRLIVKRQSDRLVLLRVTKTKPRLDAAAVKKVCVYNAYLPTMGGGENLTAHMIAYINKVFPSASIDLLCHETEAFDESKFVGNELVRMLEKEFDLTLNNTAVRFVNVEHKQAGRFGRISNIQQLSSITKEYDLFINNSYSSLVPAYAKVNIYSCMFPLKLDLSVIPFLGTFRRLFYTRFLESYDLFLSISQYTQKWVDEYWKVNSYVLYPPVKTKHFSQNLHKENMIINIGRFFAGGHNKKQDIMVKAFIDMYDQGCAKDWKLVLIGRKHTDKESHRFIHVLEETTRGYPIELKYDTSVEELQNLLEKAKIYWHATGYEERSKLNPEKFEHFGLSTIEAAQFGAVPVVFNGGGQPEIIKHAQNGFLWDNTEELMQYTKLLVENNSVWNELSRATVDSMKIFDVQKQLRWFVLFLSSYYKFE